MYMYIHIRIYMYINVYVHTNRHELSHTKRLSGSDQIQIGYTRTLYCTCSLSLPLIREGRAASQRVWLSHVVQCTCSVPPFDV